MLAIDGEGSHDPRMLIVIWPLLVAVIGLFMWFSISNAKWQDVGKLLFFVGAFWTVYLLTGSDFSIAHGRR